MLNPKRFGTWKKLGGTPKLIVKCNPLPFPRKSPPLGYCQVTLPNGTSELYSLYTVSISNPIWFNASSELRNDLPIKSGIGTVFSGCEILSLIVRPSLTLVFGLGYWSTIVPGSNTLVNRVSETKIL